MPGLAPIGAVPIGGFHVATVSLNAYVLTASPGAYALTGAGVSIIDTPPTTYKLVMQRGIYSVTGTNSIPKYGRKLALAGGVYAQTGGAAALRRGYYMGVRAELVVNGKASLGTTGWTVAGAYTTLSVSSGAFTLTQGALASFGYAYQELDVAIGTSYRLTALLASGSADAVVNIGSSPGASDIGTTTVGGGVGIIALDFTPTVTPIYVSMTTSVANSCSAQFDNVSIIGDGTARYTLSGVLLGTTIHLGAYLLAKGAIFSLTGSSITIRYSKVQLDGGVYGYAGSPLSFSRGRSISLQGGSFALTGAAVTTRYRRLLRIAAGAYLTTGSAIRALYGMCLHAASGHYEITGGDVTPRNRRLTLQGGSYALTGTAMAPKVGRKLLVSGGVYALTGASVLVRAGRRLSAAPGQYALTGTDPAIRAQRKLSLAPGAYALTGAAALIRRGFKLRPASGTYALTGGPLRYVMARRITIHGSYVLTFPDAVLDYQRRQPGPRALPVGPAPDREVVAEPQERHVFADAQDRHLVVPPLERDV